MQRTFLRDKDILGDNFCEWLALMGRLKDGISIGEVRADLGVIAARLDQIQPGRATTLKIEKATLAGAPQMRTLVLAGTVWSFVLRHSFGVRHSDFVIFQSLLTSAATNL